TRLSRFGAAVNVGLSHTIEVCFSRSYVAYGGVGLASHRALLGVLILLAMAAPRARAAPTGLSDEKRAEAREHYANGSRKFNVAKFDEAAAEFVAAYELVGEPSLLYNIAQSYRMAEQHEKALFFFKTF